MVDLSAVRELAIIKYIGNLDTISALPIREVIRLFDDKTSNLAPSKRAVVYEAVYPKLIEHYDGLEKLDAVGCLNCRIADLKRDSGILKQKNGAFDRYRFAMDCHVNTRSRPDMALCMLGLGACFEMSQDYVRAADCYDAGCDLIEDDRSKKLLYGRLLLRKGTTLTKRSEFARALPLLRDALEAAAGAGSKEAMNFATQKLIIHAMRSADTAKALRLFDELPKLDARLSPLQEIQQELLKADFALSTGEQEMGRVLLEQAEKRILDGDYVHQLGALRRLNLKLASTTGRKRKGK